MADTDPDTAEQAPPRPSVSGSTSLGPIKFLLSQAMTLVDHADIVLDLIFAVSLLRRGGLENLIYGGLLIGGTVWAVLIETMHKKILSRPDRGEDWKWFCTMMTESLIFFVEDCTMVIVIANIAGAYDGSDPQNVATVIASLVSAVVSICLCFLVMWYEFQYGKGFFRDEILRSSDLLPFIPFFKIFLDYLIQDGFSWLAFILFLVPIMTTGYFVYLLLRILTEGTLVGLSLEFLIPAWTLYGIQICIAILFTLLFLGDVFDKEEFYGDAEAEAPPVGKAKSERSVRSVRSVRSLVEYDC